MGDYCLNSFPTQPAHKFKYFPESLFKYHYNVAKYCVKQRKREKQKEREGEKELKMNLKISLHSFHISAQQVERPLKTSLLDPLRYLAYINIYVCVQSDTILYEIYINCIADDNKIRQRNYYNRNFNCCVPNKHLNVYIIYIHIIIPD